MNLGRVLVAASLMLLFAIATVAQDNNGESKPENGFEFTLIKDIPHTPVKDQYRSSTCWAFAGVSFMESELLRNGKDETNLSEMFLVYHCYYDKAQKYIRMHGNTNFGSGGAFHDVLYVMKNYGLVPEEEYPGIEYDEEKHVHGEMDKVLKNIVDGVLENKNKNLSSVWDETVTGTLDSYLGELPTGFVFDKKKYSPNTFLVSYCELNPDDYVQLSSFTHHPFYSQFIIEVPDNWLWGSVYNLPLDQLMQTIDYSLENDFTVAWAADVSEKGFATRGKGVAVVPDVDYSEMSDTEISRWEALSKKEKDKELNNIGKPGKEKEITEEMRQEAFDNYLTTDDHGMHIIGLAKDQNGKRYFKVKNSWGEYNRYDGYFYASDAYLKYKTMSIMVHKDAIPMEIREKLGL